MPRQFEFESPLTGRTLKDELAQRDQKLLAEIQRTARPAVQTHVDEGAYIADFVRRYTIPLPQLDFGTIQKSGGYVDVHGSQMPGAVILRDRTYSVWAVTYTLRGSGDLQLLRYLPRSGASTWYPQVELQYQDLSFEIRSMTKDVEEIKREKERVLSFLKERLTAAHSEIDEHNQALQGNVSRWFQQQKETILADQALLDQL